MKTLFLYESSFDLLLKIQFFELEGCYTQFDGVVVNDFDSNKKLSEDLCAIIFDEEGNYKVKLFNEPTKDWDFFVKVGFYG